MTHDEIALCAYEIWKQKGCPPGSAVENWLEAERRLKLRFDVVLTHADENRLVTLVRTLRDYSGDDLLTVKQRVERLPQPVARSLRREEAERLVASLDADGGTAEVQPSERD